MVVSRAILPPVVAAHYAPSRRGVYGPSGPPYAGAARWRAPPSDRARRGRARGGLRGARRRPAAGQARPLPALPARRARRCRRRPSTAQATRRRPARIVAGRPVHDRVRRDAWRRAGHVAGGPPGTTFDGHRRLVAHGDRAAPGPASSRSATSTPTRPRPRPARRRFAFTVNVEAGRPGDRRASAPSRGLSRAGPAGPPRLPRRGVLSGRDARGGHPVDLLRTTTGRIPVVAELLRRAQPARRSRRRRRRSAGSTVPTPAAPTTARRARARARRSPGYGGPEADGGERDGGRRAPLQEGRPLLAAHHPGRPPARAGCATTSPSAPRGGSSRRSG